MTWKGIAYKATVVLLGMAVIAGLAAVVVQADSTTTGYATLKDFDVTDETFSFSQGAVVSDGSGDFFIADRGDNSVIHVFAGEAVIDMGAVPLDSVDEAPASGYQSSAEPIVGHSYVMQFGGTYGKIQLIASRYSSTGREYFFMWVYQPSGSRSFSGGGWSAEPTANPDTGPTPTEAPSGYSADLVITHGDMDNLGFGWPSGFDLFSGQSTPVHEYPWAIDPDDPAGTDRIMLGTSYDGNPPAGSDGYTSRTSRSENLPEAITMQYSLGGVQVNSAIIQMFVDDFQSPVWKSRFHATLNGQRAPFLEDILNSLRQTGPIGKLITAQVPQTFLSAIASGSLEIYIDDPTTGAGDGYAVDFVQILINPRDADYTGSVSGNVYDSATGYAISGATVSASGVVSAQTDSQGAYSLAGVPAGLATVKASKSGYMSQTLSRDLPSGESVTIDFELTEGVDPTVPPAPTATPTPGPGETPSPTPVPDFATLTADSVTVEAGGTAQVAIRLSNVENLATLGFNLTYDSSVVQVTDVTRGALLRSFTFVPNSNEAGIVRFGFASTAELSGDGWAAVVEFQAVGAEGSSSNLNLTDVVATDGDGTALDIVEQDGRITIGSPDKGDSNGDGRLDESDALHALRMYVKLEPEDRVADMNDSGDVTPDDARIIMQQAAQRRG